MFHGIYFPRLWRKWGGEPAGAKKFSCCQRGKKFHTIKGEEGRGGLKRKLPLPPEIDSDSGSKSSIYWVASGIHSSSASISDFGLDFKMLYKLYDTSVRNLIEP